MTHTFVTVGSAGDAAAGSGLGSGSFMGDKIIFPTFLRSWMRSMALPTWKKKPLKSVKAARFFAGGKNYIL